MTPWINNQLSLSRISSKIISDELYRAPYGFSLQFCWSCPVGPPLYRFYTMEVQSFSPWGQWRALRRKPGLTLFLLRHGLAGNLDDPIFTICQRQGFLSHRPTGYVSGSLRLAAAAAPWEVYSRCSILYTNLDTKGIHFSPPLCGGNGGEDWIPGD